MLRSLSLIHIYEERQTALEAVQGLADQMGGDESFEEVLAQQYFTRDRCV